MKYTFTEEKVFKYILWWRLLYGTTKTLLGITLIFFAGSSFSDVFQALMSHELSEDPGDVLINFITPYIHDSPWTITHFLALYFMLWGATEAFLSFGLLHGKVWAYRIGMWVIGSFILYELYRLMHTHSIVLGIVIVIDFLLVMFIRRHNVKAHKLHNSNLKKPPLMRRL